MKIGLRKSGKYEATIQKAKQMIQETQGEKWATVFI